MRELIDCHPQYQRSRVSALDYAIRADDRRAVTQSRPPVQQHLRVQRARHVVGCHQVGRRVLRLGHQVGRIGGVHVAGGIVMRYQAVQFAQHPHRLIPHGWVVGRFNEGIRSLIAAFWRCRPLHFDRFAQCNLTVLAGRFARRLVAFIDQRRRRALPTIVAGLVESCQSLIDLPIEIDYGHHAIGQVGVILADDGLKFIAANPLDGATVANL